MNTRTLTCLLASALVSSSLIAQEPPPPEGHGARGPHGMGGGHRNPMEMFQKLAGNPDALKNAGATEQQIEALKTFLKEQEVKLVDLRSAVEKTQVTFRQTEMEGKSDEAAILKAFDATTAARAALAREEVIGRIRVKSILGEAVLKKLHENRPQRPDMKPGEGKDQDDDKKADRPKHDGKKKRQGPPPAGE